MANETISPEVRNSLADMDGARMQENSANDFPRHFWSASKNGHYRFALAGVAIGAPISAAIGAAVAGLVGWALAPLIIPAFIAAGTLMAVEGFGAMGAAASARASGLAERHARLLDAESKGKDKLAALDDPLMHDGRAHNYGAPAGPPKGKLFSVKSGAIGGLLGAVSGAVLGLGGMLAHIGPGAAIAAGIAKVPAIAALTHLVAGTALAAAAPMIGVAIAGAVVFGIFGMTFGVERKVFKSFFNRTDTVLAGQSGQGPDLAKTQTGLSDQELQVQREQRMGNMGALERDYNDRIFWGSLNGRFRGFAGVVPGVAIGAAAGAVALGVCALASVAVPALALVAVFAAAGGLLGMKVYSEAGTEAGAEATARAIDTEFERNRELRARGITPTPQKAKSSWITAKAGLLSMALGAAVGIALGAALVPSLVAIIGAHVMGFHLATSTALAASAIIGGGVGATYGLGDKTLKAMTKPALWLYDKATGAPSTKKSQPAVEQMPVVTAPIQTVAYEPITAEDMAILNQRQAAITPKSFTQTLTQQQIAPVTNVTVSM